VIGIGLYDLTPEGLLRRRRLVRTEVTGERTVVPELAGEPLPDALVLNDGDLDYARVRFDPLSQRVLAAAALEVGDPVTEAVCWNAFWDMVTSATLPAAEFADLVGRRLASAASLPEAAVEVLLERAVLAADVWAHPALRPGIRERLADAIGTGNQRGFAAAAESRAQLALLRTWLGNPELDADLRARVLFTLAARGLADDAEIDALASLDPVAGEVNRATGLAMRPTAAAKAAAWEAALSATTSPQLAQAHARGIWVPGQEPELMAGYRDRYFAEALPALRLREPEVRRELGGLLFPATLVSAAVIDAADAAGDAEQAAIMRSVLAARRR
jgi:aminopeptidase N